MKIKARNHIETTTATPPACWASYLINGDGAETLNADDMRVIGEIHRLYGQCVSCTDESPLSGTKQPPCCLRN